MSSLELMAIDMSKTQTVGLATPPHYIKNEELRKKFGPIGPNYS